MRNDPGRFCPVGVNQIAQVPVVVLDVGLPGANRLPFEPEESHVKSNLTLLGELVDSARVFGQKNADDADSAGEAYGAHKIIHGEIGYLLAVRLVTLIAYAFSTPVGALSAGLR
jgi:hypothetical protein